MARIIIADDDDLVVEVVRRALELEGHVVGSLPDGKDLKKVVELKQPHLVILDCSMPQRSGIEALRDIRSSWTAYGTPILMLTSRDGQTDEGIAMLAGANDYLRKPFDVDQMIVRVTALLKSAADRSFRDGAQAKSSLR